MKKCMSLVLLCVGLISSIFAYADEKDTRDLVYCPQEMYCSHAGDVASCKPEGTGMENWRNAPLALHSAIENQMYYFKSAVTQFCSKTTKLDIAACYYGSHDPSDDTDILLISAPQRNLEAIHNQYSDWKKNKDPVTPALIETCDATSSVSCPLADKQGLILDGRNGSGSTVKILADFNGGLFIENKYTLQFIPYNDVLVKACNYAKQCEVKIQLGLPSGHGEWRYMDAGSIVIDLTDNMKILSLDAASGLPYILRQEKPFNAVMFAKTSIAEHSVADLQ